MRHILLAITLCASACGARSAHPTLSPATRADVLSHYARGESLDKIAADFHLGDRSDVRAVLHDTMVSLSRRYYRDY
jgi:hypothetical protein